MKEAIVQEIISDLINIDPDLKNIKSELEKLIQELIANKPQTPFTQEFKDSLKAQIIGAINEQKILYEEKKWDRNSMFHSIKFWMLGISTVTAGLLMFTLFHYIEDIQQPTTQITYTQNSSDIAILKSKSNEDTKEIIQEQSTIKTRTTSEESTTTNLGGGASNSADNVMMAIPEIEDKTNNVIRTEDGMIQLPEEDFEEYSMMSKTAPIENNDLARRDFTSDEATSTTATSPTFCETSKQFLLANNITENSTKTFSYDNQIYKATINFTSNNINIDHIGTQDDNKTQTELPNLNVFFEKNNFNIKSDYLSPIIEESENIIEYYYLKSNNQEGITVRIDKTSNIIFSIQNICLYQ